jgi:aminoglycoside phosphotransferase (APT) family kinase protein
MVGEQVSGVIDWAGGAAGDPRYDIALACRPKPEVFQIPAEIDAFFEGYGGSPLSEEEYEYFVGLYEIF